jgi:hypothetical protein
LATARLWAAGFAPPATALKVSAWGVTLSAGGAGGVSVSVTGICFGEPVAPAAATVTVAVCVPAARPVVSSETVMSCAASPLAGETDSQLALSLAV